MNPSRWRQINDLFHALLELDAAARDTSLSALDAGDPDLAREVRSLLRSHLRSPDFLDGPVWETAPALLTEDGLEPGGMVGSYRIIEEVGRGGMGVVYAATDERLGRLIALKALPAEFNGDPIRRARLTREARAAAALSHPGIATVFALEEIDGRLFIVSELVRGRTLREELRYGALPDSLLLPTLIQIAEALEAAHASGIIHRDLKPENIVRREDGRIKVLDFGLAQWELRSDTPSFTRLTQAGVALGTPGYMAPEQLAGEATDARTDIFAFGVLMWELATGTHPFGTGPGDVLARMTELLDGRSVPQSRPRPGLDRVALACMRALPAERCPTMASALGELHGITANGPAEVMSASGPEHGPALWWWQFHQAVVSAVDVAAPFVALMVRRSVSSPYARWSFLAVLALATVAVTLRLNLLFTCRVHREMLAGHRRRLFPAIASAEIGIAVILLGTVLAMPPSSDAAAAVAVSLGIVLLSSLTLIEPATTAAAGVGSSRDPA